MVEASRSALGIDRLVPNIARMYDYWLGGKDNFAADREGAERMARAIPQLPWLARQNRDFLRRAVRFCSGEGVTQFLDIGSGLPTNQNVTAQPWVRHTMPAQSRAFPRKRPRAMCPSLRPLPESRRCLRVKVFLSGKGGKDQRCAPGLPLVEHGHRSVCSLRSATGYPFSPLLAVEEQGDGLVDAALARVGALGSIDVIDVIPLHAVGELRKEGSGSLISR